MEEVGSKMGILIMNTAWMCSFQGQITNGPIFILSGSM